MKPDPTRWTDSASEVSATLRAALIELRERPVDGNAVGALVESLCSQPVPRHPPALKPPPTLRLTKLWVACSALALLQPGSPQRPSQPAAEHPHKPSPHDRASTTKQSSGDTAAAGEVSLREQTVARALQPSDELEVVRPHKRVSAPRRAEMQAPGGSAAQGELPLLVQAQSALERNAVRALELADQHARIYPRGIFAQEREVLALEALVKLSRHPQAVERADAFLRTQHNSPHTRRVRALLKRSRTSTVETVVDERLLQPGLGRQPPGGHRSLPVPEH